MIATSGFLTALECIAPPDSLAGIRGPTYKGDGERKGRGEGNRKGRGRTPLSQIPGSAPAVDIFNEAQCLIASKHNDMRN